MKGRSLDDLSLFRAVAEGGSLAKAAAATGTSPPTLSRRMAEFETRVGQRLFHRGPKGYALTAAGRQLMQDSAALPGVAARLAAFAQSAARPRIRLTTGPWTARFLAHHIQRIWSPDTAWILEFTAAHQRLDIARREADIGIRNHRPDQNWLSGRKTSTITCATYARDDTVTGYITLPDALATTPTTRWVHRHHGDNINTTVNDMRIALELARLGMGQIVLPCFVVTPETGLQQVGPTIPELTTEEWLVAHHEARNDPPIRDALDRIAALLTDTGLRPVPAD